MKLGREAIILVLAVGLLLRLAFLAAGPDSIVRVVPDDAFYYLQIARHIVAGNGSTFDGIYPANGYHPLWMMLILPIAALIGDPLTLVRFVLGLGVLFSFLSALILVRLLRRISGLAWIPLFGVYLYFLDPRTIASSLNGLETSLSTLLFVITLYLTLDVKSKVVALGSDVLTAENAESAKASNISALSARSALEQAPTITPRLNRETIKSKLIDYEPILGLSLGLLLLARTDNVFFVIAFCLIAAVRTAQPLRLRRWLVLAGVMAVVVSPWFAWNWIQFGSPVQSSALAVPHVLRESYLLEGHTPAQMLAHSLELFVSFLGGPGLPHVLTGAAVAVSWLLLDRYRRGAHLDDSVLIRRSILIVLSLWLGGTLLIFSHTFLRWHPREWYFDQLGVLSVVSLCLTLAALATTRTWPMISRMLSPARVANSVVGRMAIVVLIVLALLAPIIRGIELYMTGVFPQQTEMLDAAHWLRTHLSEEESAAAFNAGIMAFFSGRRVVNLDGAVNNAAYAAIRRKDLMNLVYQSGAHYYLDYDPVMLKLYSSYLGAMVKQAQLSVVQEIDRPDVEWNNSNIRIYRLSWLQ